MCLKFIYPCIYPDSHALSIVWDERINTRIILFQIGFVQCVKSL